MRDFCLLLVFCTIICYSHNWMGSPEARARGKGSPIHPAPREEITPTGTDRFRHIEVGAGQDFVIEWAVGHPHYYAYFAVMKAEDEHYADTHTWDLLNDYVDSAPPEAYKFTDAKWERTHVSCSYFFPDTPPIEGEAYPYKFQDKCASKVQATDGTYSESKYSPITPYPYEFHLDTTDPRYYNRSMFRSGWEYVAQFTYLREDLDKWDTRVEYYNENYPWIESVHKFQLFYRGDGLQPGIAQEYDAAKFSITGNKGSGRYVVQYLWNGYADMLQVDLYPHETNDIYGYTAGSLLVKKEHCFFPNYELKEIYYVQANMPYALDTCVAACEESGSCQALNIVPITPRGDTNLMYDTYFPWHLDGVEQPEIPDWIDAERDFVCTLIKVEDPIDPAFNPTVEFQYYESADPQDPIFYSACYVGIEQKAFDNNGDCPICEEEYETLRAGGAGTEVEKPWKFEDFCVKCENFALMAQPNTAILWETSQGDCRKCD